jgi:hypothetical protein
MTSRAALPILNRALSPAGVIFIAGQFHAAGLTRKNWRKLRADEDRRWWTMLNKQVSPIAEFLKRKI